MIRLLRAIRAVIVMIILVGGALRSNAQSPATAPSTQAALDEAAQLGKLVVQLYGEGKYREAVAPAERALALREKALGPNHPDVANSLNNLAELYRVQGAYARAEPLLARALDIREKE